MYLKAIHSKNITDFYSTAIVKRNGTRLELFDGTVKVAIIDGIKAKILLRYLTDWQVEEVREFLRQNHFEVGSMSVTELKKRYPNC